MTYFELMQSFEFVHCHLTLSTFGSTIRLLPDRGAVYVELGSWGTAFYNL